MQKILVVICAFAIAEMILLGLLGYLGWLFDEPLTRKQLHGITIPLAIWWVSRGLFSSEDSDA